MSNGYRLAVAGDRRTIEDAERVRFRVYVEQEQLLREDEHAAGLEVESRDFSAGTTHLVVYRGDVPVGTVRLSLPESRASGRPRGFEIEHHFELDGFAGPDISVAEVTRYCVLRECRGSRVAALLFEGLQGESLRRGVTHWVALATLGTSGPGHAALIHRAVVAKGLLTTRFAARLRCDATRTRQPARSRELESSGTLPTTLSLFLTKMGGQGMGQPVYDERFHVYALPIVVDLHRGTQLKSESRSRGLLRGEAAPSR